MSSVVHLNQIVQVKKRRKWGYATVDLINKDGSVRKRDKTLVVRFPEGAREASAVGSLWQLSGKEYLNSFQVNDLTITEYTIDAYEIKYLRPSGRILARWISSNIRGIGSVIANRLVRLKNLSALVQNRDREALLAVSGMSNERVERLFNNWPDDTLHETMEWLEALDLPMSLGAKLVSIFGERAIAEVEAHPFLLMAMGASFEKTMQITTSLGLSLDDECVLAGVAQHVAVSHTSRTKSTVIDQALLVRECSRLLKSDVRATVGEIAVTNRLLVSVSGGYQVWGTALMETAVAKFLQEAHSRQPGAYALVAAWEKQLTREAVTEALLSYQSTLNFELTFEQSRAIVGAVMSPVACISGGAGTGKTTILNAILGVYETVGSGVPCYQVALSGRAAQRMAESTGRPAQTIAKLISDHLGDEKPSLPPHLLLVIDEASMVDLLSMYRLVGMLPRATRILFVGDTAQLPPVGSGLVFHALFDTPIPFLNLTQVKRQSDESPIHHFAMSVRNGRLCLPPKTQTTLADSAACSIDGTPCIDRIIEYWSESGGIENCIILSPLRRGEFGVENLNRRLQEHCGLGRSAVHYPDPQRGWIPWITAGGTKLFEGDAVLVTENNYSESADVRNGDLGVITEVMSEVGIDGVLGTMRVNGNDISITSDLLEKLSLGFAITIHKSQGSQWPTCLVTLPQEAANMLDQTVLYTACTRPIDRLVLLGGINVIAAAMARGSLALSRQTFLRERLMLAASV
ncbi:AAA family ATPase [Ferrimonas sediminicola]|uniref:AAA family ATPase n=1 Tax=Ferrimonas sediminicola TaxID=2569538 RepID=A0A4V5NXI1_9GAMM|nr:AAA family ATPase [Ferrimonas sediminicola]TKB51191.1 AAA family ATPase [Ferrimonas sediminicola]